jgi:hypothetical protein
MSVMRLFHGGWMKLASVNPESTGGYGRDSEERHVTRAEDA